MTVQILKQVSYAVYHNWTYGRDLTVCYHGGSSRYGQGLDKGVSCYFRVL